MAYVIYSAYINGETVFNLTCNPYIDFSYLKGRYGIDSITVFTPYLSISQAFYAVSALNRGSALLKRLPVGGGRGVGMHKNGRVVLALKIIGVRHLKTPKAINTAVGLPDRHDIGGMRDALKGRIASYPALREYIGKNVRFKNDPEDILQTMYICGMLDIYPSLIINAPNRGFVCRVCGLELNADFLYGGDRCPQCGTTIDADEPLFACPADRHGMTAHLEFKEDKGLSTQQRDASMKLRMFLKSRSGECLLWSVPESYNIGVLSEGVRDVLSGGGNCAIVLADASERTKCLEYLKERLPASECAIYGNGQFRCCDGDILICGPEEIGDFYRAFDLMIFSESPGRFMSPPSRCRTLGRKALREDGKIVYSTSSPDFDTYRRVSSGEISFAAVPLHDGGVLTPEPRIVTYGSSSAGDFYISDEVSDIILWSIRNNKRVRIVAPSAAHARLIYHRLIECEKISRKWTNPKSDMILITVPSRDHMNIRGRENIMVLFADESGIFDEKTLLDAAGISAESGGNEPGEVIFAGSRESDEMYNARLMMRFFNKQAWEMGYLR